MNCMNCHNPTTKKPDTPKLITLGDENQPTISLVRGHVTAEVFNEAFNAEWYGDPIHEDQIEHGYWAPHSDNKGWRKVEKGAPGAEPMTATYW
jgi:hypothetical protein